MHVMYVCMVTSSNTMKILSTGSSIATALARSPQILNGYEPNIEKYMLKLACTLVRYFPGNTVHIFLPYFQGKDA